MAGDHLSARQKATTYYGQHSLSTTSGLAYVSSGVDPAASKIHLPRCGKMGMPLVDKHARVTTSAPDVNSGMTMEAVYRTTVAGFNFFGGLWIRNIVRWWGWYGVSIGIEMWAMYDSISDTLGRAVCSIGDGGGSWVTSRLTHEFVRINDGLPHHLALRWPERPSTQAQLFVDGRLVETVQLSQQMLDLNPSEFYASAEASFTHCDGDVSHMCASPVKSVAEIKARALLVNGAAGKVLTDQGKVMGWSASESAWIPAKAWSTANSGWRTPQ